MITDYNKEILRKYKIPMDNNNYLGIEIEFLSCAKYNKLAEWVVENDLQYTWNLGHDRSVQSERTRVVTRTIHDWARDFNGLIIHPARREDIKERYVHHVGTGYELRILIKEKDLMRTLKQVDEFIKVADGWVNDTCGLHVHLDMRNRNPTKAANLLYKKQNEMFKMVPDERRYNTYCKKANKTAILRSLKKPGERYRAINTAAYSSKRTIEIRLHEATLSTGQIALWCKYLISIVEGNKLTKQVGKYVQQKITANAS